MSRELELQMKWEWSCGGHEMTKDIPWVRKIRMQGGYDKADGVRIRAKGVRRCHG